MRKHFVWHKGDWVEYVPVKGQKRGPILLRDTRGYHNVIDGKWIDGRAEHREFLRRNNVHEVGTEPISTKPAEPSYAEKKDLREDIGKAYNMISEGYQPEPAMSESAFRAIGD
jgi:hypothetical protein